MRRGALKPKVVDVDPGLVERFLREETGVEERRLREDN